MRRLYPYDKNEFWKAVKYLTKRKSPPPILSHNGTVASTSLEKASMLNTFFGYCFNHRVSPLDFQVINWNPFPVALMIYFVQLRRFNGYWNILIYQNPMVQMASQLGC